MLNGILAPWAMVPRLREVSEKCGCAWVFSVNKAKENASINFTMPAVWQTLFLKIYPSMIECNTLFIFLPPKQNLEIKQRVGKFGPQVYVGKHAGNGVPELGVSGSFVHHKIEKPLAFAKPQ